MSREVELERVLLEEILQDPKADAPRLILADWWQEQAEAVAHELAAVRAELANTPKETQGTIRWSDGSATKGTVPNGRYHALRHRERELAPVAALAERAEFVRVQCELAGGDWKCRAGKFWSCEIKDRKDTWCAACARKDALRHRERELWDALCEDLYDECATLFAAEWGHSIGKGCEVEVRVRDVGFASLSYRRGFVAAVHAPLAALLEHLPAVVACHPIEENGVRATDREPDGPHNEPGDWAWLSRSDATWDLMNPSLPPSFLPEFLLDRPELRRQGWHSGCFPTPEAAHAALGAALLAWAREKMSPKVQNPALPDVP